MTSAAALLASDCLRQLHAVSC